jgi:hypothetical protein
MSVFITEVGDLPVFIMGGAKCTKFITAGAKHTSVNQGASISDMAYQTYKYQHSSQGRVKYAIIHRSGPNMHISITEETKHASNHHRGVKLASRVT